MKPAYGRARWIVFPPITPGCMRSLFEITSRSVPSASTTLMRSTVISPRFCGRALCLNADTATRLANNSVAANTACASRSWRRIERVMEHSPGPQSSAVRDRVVPPIVPLSGEELDGRVAPPGRAEAAHVLLRSARRVLLGVRALYGVADPLGARAARSNANLTV